MNPLELFNACYSRKGWKKTLLGLDYKVIGKTLVFQCSHGFWDWVMNFNFVPVYYDGILMCKGFRDMWLSFLPHLHKLGEIKQAGGYSQGAVFASLYYRHMKRKGHGIKTETFGCPRFLFWGDKSEFAGITAYRNYNDIVTKVPPFWMGFHRVGERVVFRKRWKRPSGEKWLHWVSGHGPTQYRLNLGAYV